MPSWPPRPSGTNGALVLPCDSDWLADHHRRVRALARHQLLRAAGIDRRRVEVPVRISAEAMDAPERAREVPPGSERIHEFAVQVVLQHLAGAAIERPEVAVGENVEQVDVGRGRAEAPLVEELAVLVE